MALAVSICKGADLYGRIEAVGCDLVASRQRQGARSRDSDWMVRDRQWKADDVEFPCLVPGDMEHAQDRKSGSLSMGLEAAVDPRLL